MIDHAAAAQDALRMLGASGMVGGKPVVMVGDVGDRDATMAALSNAIGATAINVNVALAPLYIEGAETRFDPAAALAALTPDMSLLLLDRIQILMLPQLKLNAIDVLTRVARRRPVCVSWPGRVENGRLRYADHNHPECLDEDASRALVLDLSINKGMER